MTLTAKFLLKAVLPVAVLLAAAPLRGDDSAIEPRALEVVEKASLALKAHPRVRFEIRDSIDILDDAGQKIQYEHSRTFDIERPNRFRASSAGDLRKVHAWYDGKVASIFMPEKNVWGQIGFEGDVDAMLDHASQQLGMQFPAADIATNDLSALIVGNAKALRYVGLHAAGGVTCHHVAFSNDGVDAQLWVRADETALPQKFVIDYKSLPGEPQYRLDVLSITFPESFEDGHFAFSAPDGAERVDLVPLAKAVEGAKE